MDTDCGAISPTGPTDGYHVDITLRGAAQALGSDTDFAQVIATGKLIEAGRTGSLQSDHARYRGLDVEGQVRRPAADRSGFSRAATRAFAATRFRTSGPERDGNVIGGSRLLTGSLEVDYAFRPQWSVAAFIDSGSAYDDEPTFFTGVGMGMRWYSPVGPMRVDVAHPLDDPSRQWRLYITIGPDL